jgi:hypothetical protein
MLQFLANDVDVLENLRWVDQSGTEAGTPQHLNMNSLVCLKNMKTATMSEVNTI